MIVVLLCGGAGTRFDNYFPKPLNLIYGLPMIYYVIKGLPNLKTLKIVHHVDLESYGFKQYLINTFRDINFEFYPIQFQTRGPAETVYLGLKGLKDEEMNQQVLLLDNDNIYTDLDLNKINSGNFVLYSKNPTGLQHYSFVKLGKGELIDNISERKPISDYICVGGYGFQDVKTCMEYCKRTVLETSDEPYMSLVISNLIKDGLPVQSHYLPDCFSIGTPNDVLLNKDKLEKKSLRFVFDLDNTLVTYPNIYKDYSTVNKMKFMTDFLKNLKQEGHTVIINTARNMVTSGHNVGKVLKNVGKTTLDSLKELGIEYDEIHFGKPYGDIYIDDKAFNTFDLSLFQQIGFYDSDNSLIDFNCNKYNKIVRTGKSQIVKFGNNIEGEIFYYKTISSNGVSKYFPKFIQHNNTNSITLEFINGTNLNKIYSEGLFQCDLFQDFMNTVKKLHRTIVDDEVKLSDEDIRNHYLQKFETRSKKRSDYPFKDFEEVYQKIKDNLLEFLSSCQDSSEAVDKNIKLSNIIHGDLWFSNIMYYKKNFVMFDMRGKFNDIPTIKGHRIYDYAKIYQSIVGLDHIINYNEYIPKFIGEPIEKVFWDNYSDDIFTLKRMTGYLIYCTFHAYEPGFELSKKEKIWNLVKSLII